MQRTHFPGSTSDAVTEQELRHREIARRAAAEGIVLLTNDGVLPLPPQAETAVYGGGALYTVKGGTGSGAVNNRSNVSIVGGLRNAGVRLTNEAWLTDYQQRYDAARTAWIKSLYAMSKPDDFMSLYQAHAANSMRLPKGAPLDDTVTETAVYVISRISGEGADRKYAPGDYLLSADEEAELADVRAHCRKLIVVLNTGGILDTGFLEKYQVSAAVLLSQAGMEGGNALADILTGKVCPSGCLTDTWAVNYSDYPSSAHFSHNDGNCIREYYTDGIYVGYRYFDSFGVKPRFPFGFGLSYTSFAVASQGISLKEGLVTARILVTNTGDRSGKKVIQLYASCPQPDGGRQQQCKELKRLIGFGKTKLLAPGEHTVLTVSAPLFGLTSFHGGIGGWYLDAGSYFLLAGSDCIRAEVIGALTLQQRVILQKTQSICPLQDALQEIQPDIRHLKAQRDAMAEAIRSNEAPVLAMDAFLAPMAEQNLPKVSQRARQLAAQMTDRQKAMLCVGQLRSGPVEIIGNAGVTVPGAAGETTHALTDLRLSSLVLADGPAGLRLQKHYQTDPETGDVLRYTRYQSLQNRLFATEFNRDDFDDHYQFCSAVPIGTLLAQSFDRKLVQEIGDLIGREMETFGVHLWLAPGMNIHRNPLCGRNYEYYSEDPLLSGQIAAALTEGVQRHPSCGTTIKHFACNNQEENRRGVSSVVSQRALREIYLKGFEIAVRESQPKAIMTSYNKLNGVHTANSRDLCTTAAREEWGFRGIIMTDWATTNSDGGSSAAKCISAGNDLVMPGTENDIREILDALSGENDHGLTREELNACAARLAETILSLTGNP